MTGTTTFLLGPPPPDISSSSASSPSSSTPAPLVDFLLPAFSRLYPDSRASRRTGTLAELRDAGRGRGGDGDGNGDGSQLYFPQPFIAWRRLSMGSGKGAAMAGDETLANGGPFDGEPTRAISTGATWTSKEELEEEYLDKCLTQYLSQDVACVQSSSACADADSPGSSLSSTRYTPTQRPPFPAVPHVQLTPLSALPQAQRVRAARPASITFNAIVCVISTAPPRSVVTRYGDTMQVTNLVVGDDTRSGFGITVWSKPRSSRETPLGRRLRETVEGLREQDVVFVENIAVGEFRGETVGSSMRRDRSRVQVLYRIRRGSGEGEEHRPRLEDDGDGDGDGNGKGSWDAEVKRRTREVVEWSIEHVHSSSSRSSSSSCAWLPDNTQDAEEW